MEQLSISTTSQSTPHMEGSSRYSKSPWIISAFLGIVGFVTLLIFVPSTTWFNWRQAFARFVLFSDYIVAPDRSFEYHQYVVLRAKTHKSGFLVLFLGSLYDTGDRGQIAESRLLLPGTYEKVQMIVPSSRFDNISATTYAPGKSLYVALYEDNGDGVLSITNDGTPQDRPAKDALGQPVIVKLTIQ